MKTLYRARRARQALAAAGLASLATGLFGSEPVDVLAISHDYLSLPRSLVVIAPVPQPPKPEGKLEIADHLGSIMTEELLGEIRHELRGASVVPADQAPATSEGLVVEARFSKLVPGSKALRKWVGYGAGTSTLEVSGEIKERATGRLVARFTHARVSWCCGHASNDKEVRSNLVDIAKDIALVVAGHFKSRQSHAWLE